MLKLAGVRCERATGGRLLGCMPDAGHWGVRRHESGGACGGLSRLFLISRVGVQAFFLVEATQLGASLWWPFDAPTVPAVSYATPVLVVRCTHYAAS